MNVNSVKIDICFEELQTWVVTGLFFMRMIQGVFWSTDIHLLCAPRMSIISLFNHATVSCWLTTKNKFVLVGWQSFLQIQISWSSITGGKSSYLNSWKLNFHEHYALLNRIDYGTVSDRPASEDLLIATLSRESQIGDLDDRPKRWNLGETFPILDGAFLL